MDTRIEVLNVISDGGFVGKDGKWNSVIFKNGKYFRNRVETLIINDAGDIFIHRYGKNNEKYRIPGGGVERDGDKAKQAYQECKEEAFIIINNIQHSGIVTEELFNDRRNTDEVITYDGKITTLFTARYVSKYTGHIPEVDKDYGMKNEGRFYPFNEISNILKPEHIQAYNSRMCNNNNNEKILPYYTPNQMDEIGVYGEDPNDNFFKVKASKDNSKWYQKYTETYDPGEDWLKLVRESYIIYMNDKSPENKQSLLELGWNPSINPMNDSIIRTVSESTKKLLNYSK